MQTESLKPFIDHWVAIFAILGLLSVLILNTFNKRREIISDTFKQEAEANKKLLDIRDLELKEKQKRIDELEHHLVEVEERCSAAQSERNSLGGILLEDLRQHWEGKAAFLHEHKTKLEKFEDEIATHHALVKKLNRQIERLENEQPS